MIYKTAYNYQMHEKISATLEFEVFKYTLQKEKGVLKRGHFTKPVIMHHPNDYYIYRAGFPL